MTAALLAFDVIAVALLLTAHRWAPRPAAIITRRERAADELMAHARIVLASLRDVHGRALIVCDELDCRATLRVLPEHRDNLTGWRCARHATKETTR